MPLFVRYLGMAVGWVGFSFAFTVLFLGMRAVLAVGGYCAEGGPYQIQTHCPGNTAWALPVSVWVGLIAVLASSFLSRGLGASVLMLPWTILFTGLGFNFLQAGLSSSPLEWTLLLLGVMFEVMGIIPAVNWLRNPVNRVAAVAGTSHVNGITIAKIVPPFSKASSDPANGASQPTLRGFDFLVLIPLWIAEMALGVWLGFLVA